VEFKKGHSLGTKEIGGTTMKVRELAARLENADPEDIVFIDTASQCLRLLNRRAGMFQPLDEHEAAAILTEPDKDFLRVLRVRF
jgi:selenocysteine lyase/cysteine desulfurase